MSRFPTGSIALAVCMAYGVSVMAQSLPRSQTFPRDGHEMARARAAAEHEWNKARCNALANKARTACLAAGQAGRGLQGPN